MVVGVLTHQCAVAGKSHQGNQGEGDAERQDDLRHDQGLGGVDAHGKDGDGGNQGDQPPHHDRYPALQQPVHDHGAGIGADRCRCQSRSKKTQCE